MIWINKAQDERVFEVTISSPKDGVPIEDHRAQFKDLSKKAGQFEGALVIFFFCV